KKGSSKAPVLRSASCLGLGNGRLTARCALDLAGVQAAGADLHLFDLPIDDGANDLQVRLPGAARLVVGVGDVVSERDALAEDVAAISLNGHGSPLDQLDARHLRAVTLAVAGLENARITALAGRELGTELLEELVRRFTLVHVASGEAAIVQCPRPRLRDE